MARKNRKRGHRGSKHVIVVRVELAPVVDKRKGVSAMSHGDESSDYESHESHGNNESQENNENDVGDPGESEAEEPDSRSDETLKALDEFERLHERDRDEFARMAAVQELGPQLKEALNVLLALSPEALETLAGIARLPEDEKRVIRRAVSLSDEAKVALRGLLAE